MDEREIVDILLRFMPIDELADPSRWSFDLFLRTSGSGLLFGALGWLYTWNRERLALKRLSEDEGEVAHITLIPEDNHVEDAGSGTVIMGSVSLCHDFFRGFFIAIRRIFGGRITHYTRLSERARRTALLRLRQEAAAHGVDKVLNVRLNTTSMGKKWARIEVLAYGTAVLPK